MKNIPLLFKITGIVFFSLIVVRVLPGILQPHHRQEVAVALSLCIIAVSSIHSAYLRYHPDSNGIAVLMVLQVVLPLPLALAGYQQAVAGYLLPALLGVVGVYVEFLLLTLLFLFTNFVLIREPKK